MAGNNPVTYFSTGSVSVLTVLFETRREKKKNTSVYRLTFYIFFHIWNDFCKCVSYYVLYITLLSTVY